MAVSVLPAIGGAENGDDAVSILDEGK